MPALKRWGLLAALMLLYSLAARAQFPWTQLVNFPSACSAGQAVTTIDTTLTCSAFGDITQVWGCTTGDCSTLNAVAGDSYDATGADTTAACKDGTTNPATCTEGECFFDTDDDELNWCTATNTWTPVPTQVWGCTTQDCSTLNATSGDSYDATGADTTAPCKDGTTNPATCTEGDCFFDTDDDELNWCTATNTWTPIGGGGTNYNSVCVTATGDQNNITSGDTFDLEYTVWEIDPDGVFNVDLANDEIDFTTGYDYFIFWRVYAWDVDTASVWSNLDWISTFCRGSRAYADGANTQLTINESCLYRNDSGSTRRIHMEVFHNDASSGIDLKAGSDIQQMLFCAWMLGPNT